METTKILVTSQIGRIQGMTMSITAEDIENGGVVIAFGGAVIITNFGEKSLAMFIKV